MLGEVKAVWQEEESCDHSGAGAPGLLLELRDLQGDVYQGRQHHLHRYKEPPVLCVHLMNPFMCVA